MASFEERVKRGKEVFNELSGGAREFKSRPYFDLVPEMAEWALATLFGDVWGRPQLEKKVRSVATMSTLVAMGREPQLKGHTNFALNLGWKPQEISEIFFHLAWYSGLPATINALRVAREVFEERGLLEQTLSTQKQSKTISSGSTEERRKKGMEVLDQLTSGHPEDLSDPQLSLVPGMEGYIVEALFGDIWGRSVIPMKIRSIATMSALCALGREPQLKGHIEWGLNVGWKKEEVSELFFHLSSYTGMPAALNALNLTYQVCKERGLV